MTYLSDTNQAFVDGIKTVENNVARAKKVGEYKLVPSGTGDKQVEGIWKWFAGKSPEGGLPTIAWGHKVTPEEWERKKIQLAPNVHKDFRYGLTDAEVEMILKDDLKEAEDLAQRDWDNYFGKSSLRLWDSLPDKYKGAMINLVFNSGPLVKKGKWIWQTLVRGILGNDDALVLRGMVTSYKKPNGERVQLTTRARDMGKALGLPWQILEKK